MLKGITKLDHCWWRLVLHSTIKAANNIFKDQTQAAPLLGKEAYESKMQVGYT